MILMQGYRYVNNVFFDVCIEFFLQVHYRVLINVHVLFLITVHEFCIVIGMLIWLVSFIKIECFSSLVWICGNFC